MRLNSDKKENFSVSDYYFFFSDKLSLKLSLVSD